MNFELKNLTNGERWRYHAYDYAYWRFRGEPKDSGYALDPEGKWFNEFLVQAAEHIYQQANSRPKAAIARADVETDATLAAHFRRQDDKRIPLKRQVQVHGERRSDGSYTPEMRAYMDCCVQQVSTNAKAFAGGSRRSYAPEGRMDAWEINEIHKALGVSVTERKTSKHEDPEELRKARIELGLAAD